MSAIFGLLYRNGRAVGEADLAPMDAALARTGLDGGGIWLRGMVGLGHRRTGLTPEDRLERQPLLGAGGRIALVADGRIDNRAELAQSLGVSRAEAKSLPDSAFILRAYEAWGEDCPGRLIG